MIAKTEIESTLKRLQNQYAATDASAKQRHLVSKLAILELSGWAEQSIEKMVLQDFNRRTRYSSAYKKQHSKRVKRNHGIETEAHFETLIMATIGYAGLGQLEKKCNQSKFKNLTAAMTNLHWSRCKLAHDYFRYSVGGIDAPSKTINTFKKIYEGLLDVQVNLKEL